MTKREEFQCHSALRVVEDFAYGGIYMMGLQG